MAKPSDGIICSRCDRISYVKDVDIRTVVMQGGSGRLKNVILCKACLREELTVRLAAMKEAELNQSYPEEELQEMTARLITIHAAQSNKPTHDGPEELDERQQAEIKAVMDSSPGPDEHRQWETDPPTTPAHDEDAALEIAAQGSDK